MKVDIIRGSFDYRMFAKAAVISFVVFNLIVLILFIGILGLTFEKLINSSYLILAFAPILNAAVNSFVNRETILQISRYEKLDELKKQCEDILQISGFKCVVQGNSESGWQFSSVKKKLVHMNNGTVNVRLHADKLEIVARKNLIQSFVPWLKKVRANEINRTAS